MKTHLFSLVLAALLLMVPAMSFADHSETAPSDDAEVHGEITVTTGAATSSSETAATESEPEEEQVDDEGNLLVNGLAVVVAIAVVGGGLWHVLKKKA